CASTNCGSSSSASSSLAIAPSLSPRSRRSVASSYSSLGVGIVPNPVLVSIVTDQDHSRGPTGRPPAPIHRRDPSAAEPQPHHLTNVSTHSSRPSSRGKEPPRARNKTGTERERKEMSCGPPPVGKKKPPPGSPPPAAPAETRIRVPR